MNSGFNLESAFNDRKESGLNRISREILAEAKLTDVAQLEQLAGFSEHSPLIGRTTRKTTRPPHVVFVLKEGWSTEIALGHGPRNQVLGEFDRHRAEDHFFRMFYSNAYGTNPTVEALLLNSPVSPVSQSPARRVLFSFSNVLPFKRAGYRTVFLSGGDSAWRNHERFWLVQGFDSYIGRAAIEKKYRVDASDNPWGVYEEYLFAALKDALVEADRDGTPLFAFVMTTNNHPPVVLPKTYVAPPLDPSVYGFAADDAIKHSILTGYHYQTDQLGRLLSWIKAGDLRDRVVLTATGDHVIKGFTDYSSLERRYLRYSVPAYFYAPPQYDRLKGVPDSVLGSHEDIFPTLFELALSESSYYRFGTPLMDKLPARSFGWIESRDFVFPRGVSSSGSRELFPWADPEARVLVNPQSVTVDDWEQAAMRHERYRKLLKEWLLIHEFERHAGRNKKT
jgi:phosphoglycerol transferase MdoB-like AlkP superfamily enzyme